MTVEHAVTCCSLPGSWSSNTSFYSCLPTVFSFPPLALDTLLFLESSPEKPFFPYLFLFDSLMGIVLGASYYQLLCSTFSPSLFLRWIFLFFSNQGREGFAEMKISRIFSWKTFTRIYPVVSISSPCSPSLLYWALLFFSNLLQRNPYVPVYSFPLVPNCTSRLLLLITIPKLGEQIREKGRECPRKLGNRNR